MEEAGCWTRPELLVWGGAPRRNRTGDPILTMEPPGTAVRNAVPQVKPDRRGQSYRFSFGAVMRSLSGHTQIVTESSRPPYQ
jgi:hypothetical protein